MEKKEIAKLYKFYRDDIDAFAEDFFKHVMVVRSPDFHREIWDCLSKDNFVLISAARGFGKSVITCLIYALHTVLFKYKSRVRIISASERLGIKAVGDIKRELETNEMLIAFFGDMKGAKWSETEIHLSNGAMIAGAGVGNQTRGFRTDLVILDDIETDETVGSSDTTMKIKQWITKSCLPTMKPGVGQFVWIGTLISPLALLAQEMTLERDGVKKLLYRAYKTLEQVKGNETWPDLWPHEELQRRKSLGGSHAFSSEYMNDPKSSEAAPIKIEHIRYWDTHKDLPLVYNDIIAIDPAYSDDEKADYKVCVVVSLDNNGNRYLKQVFRTHVPTGEFINECLNMYARCNGRCVAVGVPSGREIEFFRSFNSAAAERGLYLPVVELKNVYISATGVSTRNKLRRIVASLQPLFEQGKYFIGTEHIDAKEELLTIGSSLHDDVVDSLSYVEEIIQSKGIVADVVQEETVDRYGVLDTVGAKTNTDYGIEY